MQPGLALGPGHLLQRPRRPFTLRAPSRRHTDAWARLPLQAADPLALSSGAPTQPCTDLTRWLCGPSGHLRTQGHQHLPPPPPPAPPSTGECPTHWEEHSVQGRSVGTAPSPGTPWAWGQGPPQGTGTHVEVLRAQRASHRKTCAIPPPPLRLPACVTRWGRLSRWLPRNSVAHASSIHVLKSVPASANLFQNQQRLGAGFTQKLTKP